jgi:RNA polymerase-interacting CarD/CdnL/TRCF family regulator
MTFSVGDKVIHAFHGPGLITRMDHVQAQAGTRDCYVVDVGNRLIVWVPIDGVSELRLRPPLSMPEVAELSDILSSPAQPLKASSREREQQIKLLMRDGSPQALCELVRDLTVYVARKAPNTNDAAMLEKARTTLLAEWEMATASPNAAAEIDALLRESGRLSNLEAIEAAEASAVLRESERLEDLAASETEAAE